MNVPLLALLLRLPFGADAPAGVTPYAQAVAPSLVAVAAAPVPDDRTRFDALMAFAARERLAERPFGKIAQALAYELRGVPYVAGVLDAPAEETLLAPLDRFDCVLFVESVLALARGVAEGDASYDGYLRRVEAQRYRGGQMDGYASRLHYFAEWIVDGAARGLVEDRTAALGGVPYPKRLTFMTANRGSYRQLRDNATFAAIAGVERRLANLDLRYVPKARVRSTYDGLQAGDIVATTTSIDGLDVTHVGFAYELGGGRIGFLHASPGRGVVLADDLAAYLARNRQQTGIVVARPHG